MLKTPAVTRQGASAFGRLFLIFALVAVPATSQTAISLEQICPADVFAFASFAGVERCSAAAEELGLFQLWTEPEVQEFVKGLVAKYRELASGAPPEMQEHWEMGKRLLTGRVSLAISGMTQVWTPGFYSAPIPIPGAILALDLGAHAAEGKAMFHQMLDRFSQKMPGLERLQQKIAGHDATVLHLTNQQAPRADFCCVFTRNLLLVGLNQGLITRCLENAGRPEHETLARLPAFAHARAKVDGKPLLELFLNVEAVSSRFKGWIPDEWLAQLQGLGLAAINGLYYASGVGGGQGSDTLYFDAPAPRRGLLALGGGKPLSPETLRMIPETAVFALATKLPLGDLYDTLWGVFKSFLPSREMGFLERGLARAEAGLGFKIREDLLAALGDEVLTYFEMGKLTYFPNVVLSAGIRDRAKAGELLGKLLAMTGLQVEEKTLDQHVVKTIQLPLDLKVFGADLSPSISVLLTNDRLIVASNRLSLKPALARLGGDTARSLIASESFTQAARGLPLDGAGWLHFIDVKRAAAVGYGFLSGFAGSMDIKGIPVDLGNLPAEETVLKHIRGWCGVGSSDQDGVVLRCRSVGLGTVFALAGRFLYEAPGVPPRAVHKFIEQILPRPAQGEFGEEPGRGGGDEGDAPRGIRVRPRGGEQGGGPVNPLPPGDPREKEIQETIALLSDDLKQNPENGALYYSRGGLRHRVRDFEASAKDFAKARELGTNATTCAYNIACCMSLLGRNDEASRWLETAFRDGMKNWTLIDQDSDLDNFRGTTRFKELVDRYRK